MGICLAPPGDHVSSKARPGAATLSSSEEHDVRKFAKALFKELEDDEDDNDGIKYREMIKALKAKKPKGKVKDVVKIAEFFASISGALTSTVVPASSSDDHHKSKSKSKSKSKGKRKGKSKGKSKKGKDNTSTDCSDSGSSFM